MNKKAICLACALVCCLAATTSQAGEDGCQKIQSDHPELQLDPESLSAMAGVGLKREDLFRTIQVVARYETNGCWAGATGNFDGQLLSAGVMQWNFGQGSLQPILKRFSEKFSSPAHFEKVRDELMPKYGRRFFDSSCRAIPVGRSCSAFLAGLRGGKQQDLLPEFRSEVDALFNSQPMRQIQVDYFSRSLTRVISDLGRVFQTPKPKAWQVAWAMDIKTQQGNKFPTDSNIQKVKAIAQSSTQSDRLRRLSGIVKWYDGLCDEGTSEGVRLDCAYNVKTWPSMLDELLTKVEREETLHFTFLVSKTAQNKDGAYQANAFQRRATIVFGRGSVNGTAIEFSKSMYLD